MLLPIFIFISISTSCFFTSFSSAISLFSWPSITFHSALFSTSNVLAATDTPLVASFSLVFNSNSCSLVDKMEKIETGRGTELCMSSSKSFPFSNSFSFPSPFSGQLSSLSPSFCACTGNSAADGEGDERVEGRGKKSIAT